MAGLSLVVSVYNRPDLLARALLSIGHQSVPPDEVILADDGSRSEVLDLARGWALGSRCKVKFVTHEDRGFRLAKARNNGFRVAAGELVVSTDQDIVFTKGYLETYRRYLRQGMFLVSFPVRLSLEQSRRVTDDVIREGAYDDVVLPRQVSRIRRQQRKDRLYRWLHAWGLRPIGPKLRGGVFGVHRDDFLRVNGFDEEYEGWGNEDDDLGWRLHASGVRGRNVFAAEYPVHLYHETGDGTSPRPNAEYYRRRKREIMQGRYVAELGVASPSGSDRPILLELN